MVFLTVKELVDLVEAAKAITDLAWIDPLELEHVEEEPLDVDVPGPHPVNKVEVVSDVPREVKNIYSIGCAFLLENLIESLPHGVVVLDGSSGLSGGSCSFCVIINVKVGLVAYRDHDLGGLG